MKDLIVIALIITGMFAATIGLGIAVRGGQPWTYQAQFDRLVGTK